MPPNPITRSTHSIRLPKDEGQELKRLANERRTDVSVILLSQLGPLRKQLRRRINARNAGLIKRNGGEL